MENLITKEVCASSPHATCENPWKPHPRHDADGGFFFQDAVFVKCVTRLSLQIYLAFGYAQNSFQQIIYLTIVITSSCI